MLVFFPQVERLQSTINKLNAENVEYRDNNKTQQFEVHIQDLEQKLRDTGNAAVCPPALDSVTPVVTIDRIQRMAWCSFVATAAA